jgi:urea carboxylase
MFDQIRFYQVSGAELNELRDKFKTGEFTPEIKHEEFSLAQHQKLLVENAPEIEAYLQQQAVAMRRMDLEDRASLARLQTKAVHQGRKNAERLAESAQDNRADALCSDFRVTAQMAAVVQTLHVHVSAGQVVATGDELIVLEAMKMAISVKAPLAGTISSVSVEEGQLVSRNQVLMLIAPAGSTPS